MIHSPTNLPIAKLCAVNKTFTTASDHALT